MLRKNSRFFERIENFFLSLLLLLFPTQLALHFWPESAFVFGIRVDYLSPAIYMTDVLIIVLLICWFLARKANFINSIKKYRKTILVFVLFAVLNLFFSTNFEISAFRWVKYSEFLFFLFYLKSKSGISLKPLYLSAIAVSLIGVLQFSTGKSLGGLLYFLGERTFNSSTPGIALTSIFEKEFLRAYSVFSHPNSMAGYLGCLFLMLRLSKDVKYLSYKLFGFGIILLGIVFTFSISAFIALLVCYVVYLFFVRKKPGRFFAGVTITFVLLAATAQVFLGSNFAKFNKSIKERVSQRLELANVSGQMISKNLSTGLGLNTFVPNLPKFAIDGRPIWLLQPVHNSLLLIFSETGLVIFLLVVIGVYSVIKKNKKPVLLISLVFVLITGSTDHYWLTLQQNNLLLVLLISYFI